MTTVLLFTGSYPYAAAAENTFIPQELRVLQRHFDRIVVVPGSTAGDREDLDLPNVIVDTSFADFARDNLQKWKRLIFAFADSEFLGEWAANSRLLLRHPGALRRTVGHYVQSKMAEVWMGHAFDRLGLSADESVAYTWWFDAATLGLSRFGSRKGLRVATRAHGYDLYEARHSPPYIPFRRKGLERVRRVYPDSEAGSRHLRTTYPASSSKIETALLGIDDPGFLNGPSTDGVVRIFSCSFLSPVKRIDLLIRGLAVLGTQSPELRVSWTHVGNGPEKPALVTLAAAELPSNVRWEMKEYRGKEALHEFYRANPIDMFLNVSQSEGTAVALIEALSVGIPVLCTSVGGNIEVAGNGNGMLIAANPSPEEVAEGMRQMLANPEELEKRRAASRALWEARYNAQKNYSAFAKSLRAV